MRIKEIRLENIRGFSDARLDLSRDNAVFVGENNTGKTSILIILEWLFNKLDRKYLESDTVMPGGWHSVLLPARETRNRARRITLAVDVHDGRKLRKYADDDGQVTMRINLRLSPPKVVVRLGPARKGEPFASDGKAMDLLDELKSAYDYHYVSPYRGHGSDNIKAIFYEAFKRRLDDWYKGLGSNANERRDFGGLVESLAAMSNEKLDPILGRIMSVLPNGMIPESIIDPNIDEEVLLDLVASQASLRVSTGLHDNSFVSPELVGSGLRSMLELAAQAEPRRNRKTILAVDEPEAFLHPIAQRMLAKELLQMDVSQRFISTHSPVMVEEADLQDVVLVKDHKFYPSVVSDKKAIEIGSALLKKHGAEMLFAKSVLLVEGESDYFFFEIMRERLLEQDDSSRLMGLYVLPVGGKQQFCPYVRLIDGFGESEHPVEWLIVADNDAVDDIKRIYSDIGFTLTQNIKDAKKVIKDHYRDRDFSSWRAATTLMNELFDEDNVNISLMPGDLEYVILEKASAEMLSGVRGLIGGGGGDIDRNQIMKSLGSKGVDGRSIDDPKKGPFIRAYIARNITPKEVTSDLRKLLARWVRPLGVSSADLERLLKKI